MDRYRHITVERQGDVFCVRLRRPRLNESEMYLFADEILSLFNNEDCRRLALSLGPQPPDCMYSVFLAKLITIQRKLRSLDGEMVLCEVAPVVMPIFEATKLDSQFHFVPDFDAAVARWANGPAESLR
jgi:anti-anti-sigma factor